MYSSFENTVLSELAERFPDLKRPLHAIIARLVDLLPMARDGYYHRDMMGSWSIKNILPTIAPELRYDTLTEVQDGEMAQQAYREAIKRETTAARKDEIRKNLLAYCKQDTLATVRIASFLVA